jgi:hypothetical protein
MLKDQIKKKNFNKNTTLNNEIEKNNKNKKIK